MVSMKKKGLFPSGRSDLYSEKGNIVKDKMEDFYNQVSAKNQEFWYQADLDHRFEAGDQSVWSEVYRNAPIKRKSIFSFNRIRRIVNMVSGHQRRGRKSTVVVPVENGDQRTSDQYTKVVSHIHRKGHVLETISDAFHDAMVTGLSFLHLWNDYRQDPVSGSLKVDYMSYNSFLIDTNFKKPDMSDCNSIWKRTFISKNQAMSLLPDKTKQVEEICDESVDNLFSFLPEADDYNRKSLLAYDEYYYLDSRKQLLLIDTTTGESMEWSGSSDESPGSPLARFLTAYPSVILSRVSVPCVKLATLLQGTLLYDDKNPLGIDGYPFVPVFGYFNPSSPDYSLKIQGLVRGLRDAQYLYNRRKNIELDIFESQVNSGIIYKEDALVNPDDAFLSGQGKGLALKATAQMSDVQKITPPQVPPSMIQISELLAREISEISGVNEELLGSAVDDKAGILSMLRQGAGLTTLQGLFDQLDRSQKILGSITLSAIQANYTPGKIKRIIEEEPAPQFYSKAFGKYDAAIEDGFNTTTQKQTEFAQLLRLRELGVPVPDSTIINAATLQNKQNLIEDIEASQQQSAQREAAVQEVVNKKQLAEIELAKAKVESDISLAKERDSRVYSNIGLMQERRLEAEKDKTQSLLNLVKTLQEIDDVDINQLVKLLSLSKIVDKTTNTDKVPLVSTAIVSGVTKDTDAGGDSNKPVL